jgi:squalene-associated FAD-dependent desaturase
VDQSADGFARREAAIVVQLLVEAEMNFPPATVDASYGFCRRMCSRAGSNFRAGFLLLPREQRRAMEALYAFMRHTDDLADDLPMDSRRDALAEWRTAVKSAMENNDEARMTNDEFCNIHHSLLPALADTVARFHIPHEHLYAVIDGVEMDLDQRRFETFGDLENYCERVASAVGLACIHIWGFRGPEAFEPARQAGIALQLTNILRDLKEDAQAGRVYLPLADLRECGYSVEDLSAGVDDERLRRLMAVEVARAEQFYAASDELMEWLSPSGRRIFGLMMATYHSLLRRIARRPGNVFRRRVRLGSLKKLQLVARWSLPVIGQCGVRSTEYGVRNRDTFIGDIDTLRTVPSVAIIGGGLAGLAAAVAAVQRGMRVELFEQAPQLGGRAGSFVDSETGQRIDYCQHVAMGCCTQFLDFCRRTGIDDFFQRTAKLHFIGPEGTRHDFAPSRWLPPPLHLLPGLMNLKYISLFERWGIVRTLGKLVRQPISSLPTGEGTIGAWLRRQGQSERVIERFWSVVLTSALGETVDHASLATAQRVFLDGFLASRGASDLVLPRLPLGEIFHDRVGRWLAQRGVEVHLNATVRRIEANGVVLADGTRRQFDFTVVAVPCRNIRRLLAEDLLAAMPELANVERIEPAAITAVHLWFDRPITNLPHAVLVGRLGQWMFANIKPRPVVAPQGATTGRGFMPGAWYCQVVISASHRLPERKHDEWLSDIVCELAAIWSAAGEARLLHGRVVTQPAAVFSVSPEAEQFRPPQRTPIENLALAGDWTATGWPATMEGAVRSGCQAVERLCKQATR